MQHPGNRTRHTRARRLAFAFALLAILALPVSYRAGAAAPHPHAILQLLYEASNGIPLHHHAIEHYKAAYSVEDTADDASMEMSIRRSVVAEPHGTNSVGMYLRRDVAKSPDASQTLLAVATFALIPALLRMLAIPFPKLDLSTGHVRRLTGIAVCPDPPPPKP